MNEVDVEEVRPLTFNEKVGVGVGVMWFAVWSRYLIGEYGFEVVNPPRPDVTGYLVASSLAVLVGLVVVLTKVAVSKVRG